jgi:acyl-CoA dehydrogenase
MKRADKDLEELLVDFFASEVNPELVDSVERSGTWPRSLWQRLAATGLPWVGIAEEAGGVGGNLADVAALLRHSAFQAAPLPLLEHHLAAHVVAAAGLPHVDGPLSVTGLGPDPVPRVTGGRMSGRLTHVSWGDAVDAVAVLTEDDRGQAVVALVDGRSAKAEPGRDLAGVPTPTLVLEDADVRVCLVADVAAVRRRAEVLRCAVLAGLFGRLSEMTNVYARERHQFGKPIGAFQGVQIHLVVLAQAASMADVAVHRAVAAVDEGLGTFEAAATSLVVDELAAQACAAAHQAHGAVGMTREYPLQQVTRRINAWRQAWTPSSAVAERLGQDASAAPAFANLVARHPEENPIS